MSDDEGLVILEISTDSQVKEFGINVENKLLSVNSKTINSEAEAYSILKENLYNAALKIKDSNGIIRDIEFRHTRNTRLGMLLVPRSVDKEDVVPLENSSFKSVLSTFKNSVYKSEHDEIDQNEENKDKK